MRGALLLLLLLLSAKAFSSYDIAGDEAHFEKECATLLHNVAITIDGTQISCDSAVVSIAKEGEKLAMPFREIDLAGNISIITETGATIRCERAHLEGKEGVIDFYGEPVKFCDEKASLTATSSEMRIWFSPCADPGRVAIRQIDAIGNVSIAEEGKFKASGELAEYCPSSAERWLKLYPEREVQPLVAGEKGRLCTLSTADKGAVKMRNALFSLHSRELFLEEAEGGFPLSSGTGEKLLFSASLLYWNEVEMMIALLGNVKLKKPGEAAVASDDRVLLQWSELPAGGKLLSTLVALGKSAITTFNKEGEESSLIETEGVAIVDFNALTLSAVGTNGKEVHYRDRFGHAFGKEFRVNISSSPISPGGWSPKELYLSGNVRLLSGGILLNGELKGASQYIIADALKYTPETRTLALKSRKNGRVLYYDRINNIQMSSPKLIIVKEKGQAKPAIRGAGNVRLKFLEQEIEQIKKRFNIE